MAAPKTKKSIMRKKILGFDFVDSGTGRLLLGAGVFPVDSLEGGEGLAKGGEGGEIEGNAGDPIFGSEGAGDDFKEGAFGGALGVA